MGERASERPPSNSFSAATSYFSLPPSLHVGEPIDERTSGPYYYSRGRTHVENHVKLWSNLLLPLRPFRVNSFKEDRDRRGGSGELIKELFLSHFFHSRLSLSSAPVSSTNTTLAAIDVRKSIPAGRPTPIYSEYVLCRTTGSLSHKFQCVRIYLEHATSYTDK